MKTTKRSTFSFDEQAYAKLSELASTSGVPKTEILRRAIAVYDYLLNEAGGSDHAIKIEKEGGEKVELVFP